MTTPKERVKVQIEAIREFKAKCVGSPKLASLMTLEEILSLMSLFDALTLNELDIIIRALEE